MAVNNSDRGLFVNNPATEATDDAVQISKHLFSNSKPSNLTFDWHILHQHGLSVS